MNLREINRAHVEKLFVKLSRADHYIKLSGFVPLRGLVALGRGIVYEPGKTNELARFEAVPNKLVEFGVLGQY